MESVEVKFFDKNGVFVHKAEIPLAEVIDAGVIEWRGKHYAYRNSNTMGFNDIRFIEVEKYVLED